MPKTPSMKDTIKTKQGDKYVMPYDEKSKADVYVIKSKGEELVQRIAKLLPGADFSTMDPSKYEGAKHTFVVKGDPVMIVILDANWETIDVRFIAAY
jgi:hypothetical protein